MPFPMGNFVRALVEDEDAYTGSFLKKNNSLEKKSPSARNHKL